MPNHLVFIGTYEIPEGTFDAYDAANKEMAAFIRDNEPRFIAFQNYVNEERTEVTTIQVHPDAASFEYHLQVAASRVSAGVSMVRMKHAELYGEPSEEIVAQLRRMSERSGNWPVTVKHHLRGFPDWSED